MPTPSILILEDNAVTRREIADLAKTYGYDPIVEASKPSDAIAKWNEDGAFDVCVVDLDMENRRQAGFEFVNEIPFPPNTEILIYSGHLNELYGAIKATARRAITAYRKGQELEPFLAHLKRIADEQLSAKGGYVCESVSDREIQAKIPWIARSDVPVLITGDSGSGKERIAQDIALQSKRDGSLIRPSNCAEFTDTLLASELFGHLKDSFTGANRHRLGKVLEASGYQSDRTAGVKKDFLAWLSATPKCKPKESIAPNNEFCYKLPEGVLGGTLILDEVAELSPQAQATLLRLLDGLPIRPVGYEGMGFLPNVRIIAMTNDVRKLRDDTRFRPDLLSRLNGWHIHVDSISRRLETVRGIIRETVQDMALRDNKGKQEMLRLKTTDEAVDKICASLTNLHGGVRGIIALIRRACIFAAISGSKQIAASHVEAALVEEFRLIDKTTSPAGNGSAPQLWNIEKLQKEGVVSANTKEFYLLDFLIAGERFNQPVPNKDVREKEAIAYVNAHKENIKSTAGRRVTLMDKRGLSACKSNLRDALEKKKEAGIEIAKRECRALTRS